MSPVSEMAAHIHQHGDGVKAICFTVEDAAAAHAETVKRGARSYLKPTVQEDEHGQVVTSGIHTYGDTVHLFHRAQKL
jgi:4-hydroxyphenylpyruvate dioxygenase